MNVAETADLVRAYFSEHASRWMVHPQNLRIEYVPSPGGFGPMNFGVYDGHSAYHVKLNKERDELSAWIRASARLSAMYHAPRLLAPIEIAGRYGAVFERLPGATAARSTPARVLDEIVLMLNRMHRDPELAELVGGGSRPARDTILQYHIQMCEDDLDEIERAVPLPFFGKEGAAWMRTETDALRERIMESGAFDVEVSSAIHGDLWYGNVLVDHDGWWIIDWDDLKIGDPAHDMSLILFTTATSAADAASRRFDERAAGFAERFQLYARAALLTFVIDPVADWIEAASFPTVRDEVRADRENVHRWALARYRNLYAIC